MMTLDYRTDRSGHPRSLVHQSRKRARPTRSGCAFLIEELERRSCPSSAPGLASAAIVLPVDPNVSRVSQLVGIGATDLYQVDVDADGLLVAQVHALGFDTRLSLLDGQGQLLIQSEASSPANTDDRVAMHLTAGDYFLMVQDLTGSGSYKLGTTFTDAITPAQPLPGNSGAYSVAVADLTGNKTPDLIVADLYVDEVLVYLGAGDGTFQPPIALPVGSDAVFVATADLTGKGIQDIITANLGSNDVSVLLGNGDGTFQPAIEVPAGPGPSSVAIGDFNGDGHPDLAVTDSYGDDVQILLGQGDGTFTQGATITTSPAPFSLVAGDFDGDGRTDLAVVSFGMSDLTILQGNGDGTFTSGQQLSTGGDPTSVIAADFTGGGLPDLAVACASSYTVQIYLNDDGYFVPSTVIPTAPDPYGLAAADFNGDGRIDLAVTSYGVGGVTLLLGNGKGTFQPEAPISVGPSTTGIAAADLTGDGRVDLVAANLIDQTIVVLIGNGDGTFQAPTQTSTTTSPAAVVAADLTNNGIDDLIIPDESTNEVSILLGRGDGSFRSPILIPVGLGPSSVAVGDFTGNGILDLAVANLIDDSLSILLGTGNGLFVPGETLPTGIQPSSITAADLTGNGILDLVVSEFYTSSISIFYGNGDGTFQNQVMIPVGSQPGNPVVADFNGDGLPDIAVADSQSYVTVFMATGPESYAPPEYIPAGKGANCLAAGDLNGDGKVDLVVADSNLSGPSYVTVLMGNGDGTFTTGQTIPVGADPSSITLADVTGNGTLDIITSDAGSNDLTLLLGRGDGTFLPAITIPLPSGSQPFDLAVADLNGHDLPDIAVADYQSGDVTVLLNLGGGAFGPPEQISTAASRIAIVTADFGGDGRLDLAVADPIKDTVTILMGNGDGTFTTGQVLSVGIDPSGLVVGDFNGDGLSDLAVADASSDDVMVFLGLGDGTFSNPIVLPVGQAPNAIVTGDFLDNGITDIAVADELSNDVSVLIGRGDGTFLPAVQFQVGAEPVALVAADLSGDGYIDLVTANRTTGDLTILWGLAGGSFAAQTYGYVGHAPSALAAGDFNGDGRLDLAVADERDDQVSILYALGDRSFAPPVSVNIGIAPDYLHATPIPGGGGVYLGVSSVNSPETLGLIFASDGSLAGSVSFPLGVDPAGTAIGDFNGDGIPDVAIVPVSSSQVIVRLVASDGQLLPPTLVAPLPQPAPVVVDWNRDGTADVFELNQQGQLLLRLGQPGLPGEYESPQIIGQDLGVAFSDIALVRTPSGPVLAGLEQDQPVVWLFSVAQGPGALIGAQPITVAGAGFLVSITAGDLDNDGLDDLVLVDRGNNQLIRLYQAPDGSFSEQGPRLDVGYASSEVAIADLNHDGRADLVVSNTYSGDLSVFYGGPGGQFGPEVRLAAGLGAAVVVPQNGGLVRHTTDDPIGVTTGVFDASGLTDVVSVQSGADRISLLDGTPDGGLADPSLATSYSTGTDPIQVVAASLTGNGLTDLVVLNQGSDDISIFLNNGKGGFLTMPRVDAGDDPTGLAVRDVTDNGIPDLLVTNNQGDLLIILGNGNGTFKPYQRADQTVSLAVGDFNSDGLPEFVLSNTSLDQLSIEYGDTQSFVQGRSQGLQAPGAVAVADLNGDGNPDIIVVNKGENDILVYLGLGGNRFEAPLTFFTGTDPEGLTVADLTGTGVPDLIVANAGSNDLSIFIGVGQGANWELEPGPRLRVGDQPVSTTVADLYGDGIPDIISVDQGNNNVVVLPGVGGGFFDDTNPLTLPTGQGPILAFVGKFDAAPGLDLAVLDSGSSDLTYYSNFPSGTSTPTFIPTGGLHPIAGVMGDYNDDGYNDLVIANNGDNVITLFEGGANGLVLTDSDLLGPSVHPTGLVFSGTDSGQLYLDISAQGQDRVIPVTFILTLGTSGVTIILSLGTFGPATEAGNPSTQAATSQAGAFRGSLLSTNGQFAFDLLSAELSSQGPGSVQAAAPSSGSTSGSSQVAVAMTNVLTTLDQMINLSAGSLPGVINNLVQVAQVQISELMSLENSTMDTVAVLLVVSDGSVEVSTGNDTASSEESEPGGWPAVELARTEDSSATESNLERFLSDLERAMDGVPRDVLGESAQQTGAWPEWILRPREPGMVAVTIAGLVGPDRSNAILNSGPTPSTAAERDPDEDVAVSDLRGLDWESPPPLPTTEAASVRLGWMTPFCGMLVISSVLLGWKAARKRWRAAHSQLPVRQLPTVVGPHLTSRLRASKSLGSRASRLQDLPPWLAGPTSEG